MIRFSAAILSCLIVVCCASIPAQAQTNAGLNLVLVATGPDSVTFRAEMVTPSGLSFRMEAVYVAIAYDPALMSVRANSVMNHLFSAAGFSKDSDPGLDSNGVNPDICLYGESHPNFGSVQINQNQTFRLCRFAFYPRSRNPGSTSFCVIGNNPTGALTGYYITTTSDNQIFDPVSCLQNINFPVELSLFTASQQGSQVLLQWTTQSERGNVGFHIERRTADGGAWNTVGFVQGNGTTNREIQYLWLDASLTDAGVYEYRLRQVDADGTFEYSPVRRVQYSTEITGFTLSQNYPNPVTGDAAVTHLRYTLPERGAVRLVITDLLGREVAELVNDAMEAGTFTRTWRPAGLPAGAYVATLTARTDDGRTYRDRITLQVTR